MATTCGSCGTEDDTGSAYCLNPECGARLAPPAEELGPAPDADGESGTTAAPPGSEVSDRSTAPSRSAAAPAAGAAPAGTPVAPTDRPDRLDAVDLRHAAPNPTAASRASGPTPRRALPSWLRSARVTSGARVRSGVRPPKHLRTEPARPSAPTSPNGRFRWLPLAVVLILVAAVGIAVPWMRGDDDPGRSVQLAPAVVPAPVTLAPSTTPPPATPGATPPTSDRAEPNRTASGRDGAAAAPPRTSSPARTTKPAPSPRKTTAPPKPSLSVSTSGSHCTGWASGHGWTIHVAVTVHNGRGRSATGTHGYDRNVGGTGTYRLSGGGTSFSGELPPNLGDNPELTEPSVTWSVTVQLEDGGTLTKSGTAHRPSSC